ncbi:MAG TPA: tetratricopeptide repeat protein [Ignavibacteria bacterium]|nr:tetratricopeptide repeat protein [Ignavibacteria bacterium]
MLQGLNSYIQDIKSRINSDFLSPLFIRLANLYYHDGQYDECINICNIGLKVYPDYTTAKLMLFKAMLKLEYINEAENILLEIETKFPDLETIKSFKSELSNMRRNNKQEKIYYSNKINSPVDFHSYSKKINSIIQESYNKLDIDNACAILSDNNAKSKFIDEREFSKFTQEFESIKFDEITFPPVKTKMNPLANRKNIASVNSFFTKIKIITETLADILARQGFFKESFEAYNMLLQQDNSNKRRIQEKLYDLERNF